MESKKTETEIRMEELIRECETIVDENYLTTNDARRIIELADNLLIRYREIRESRDKWRVKFETATIKSTHSGGNE